MCILLKQLLAHRSAGSGMPLCHHSYSGRPLCSGVNVLALGRGVLRGCSAVWVALSAEMCVCQQPREEAESNVHKQLHPSWAELGLQIASLRTARLCHCTAVRRCCHVWTDIGAESSSTASCCALPLDSIEPPEPVHGHKHILKVQTHTLTLLW